MPNSKTSELLKTNKTLSDQIGQLTLKAKVCQIELAQIAADAYSEKSEPIDGMTVMPHEIEIGFDHPCKESPIGVCVYSERVVTIPGQLEFERRRKATGKSFDGTDYPENAKTDACLFCGVRK